jgi:amidophosphoribosyltransferase
LDHLRDTASLVAVHGHPHAARTVARGLRALAARGGSAAGVVAFAEAARARRAPTDAFLADEPALDALAGTVAVGERHARDEGPEPALGLLDGLRLPRTGRVGDDVVAVAVAGAFVGAGRLARELADGAALDGGDPDALLLQLLARSRQRTLVNRLVDALWKVDGGFAVIVAAPGVLVGVRDRRGLRPLVLGRVDGATVLATTESALRGAGAEPVRSVAPGEMVIVDARGLASVRPFVAREPSPCAQEWVALGEPVDAVDGVSAWTVRERLGEALGKVFPSEADVVVAASAGAAPVAAGLGRALGLPVVPGLVGRAGAPQAVPAVVAGRRVALVGTGALRVLAREVDALLAAGVAEVHVLGASARPVRACAYGVDGPVAEPAEGDAIAAALGAASATALPVAALRTALRDAPGTPCAACLGEAWPVPPVDEAEEQLPLFRGASDVS